MKTFSWLCMVGLVIVICSATNAQVTNLVVNGSSTSFSMTSGDTIAWDYDIPAGGTATCEIWLDVNDNQAIDLLTDKKLFIFTQTDGDNNGNGGPPDLDGLANGHVMFAFPLGFAPGKYVMKFTHNSVSASVTGTILAISSPDFTISGTVTPPSGESAQYILIEANHDSGDGIFWNAVTNNLGQYTIAMRNDGDPRSWRIRVESNFSPSILTPEYLIVANGTSETGMDFAFLDASAQVAGYLRDENNVPILDRGIQLRRQDGTVSRYGRTDFDGFFQVGLLAGDLNGQTWYMQADCNCNGQSTTTELSAQASLPVIIPNDSLFRSLVVYTVNSQISGQIRVNGVPPGFPIQIFATNSDTAQAWTWSDSTTGNFSVNVTDKIYNYFLSANNLPLNWSAEKVLAHPGETGIIVNITISSVKERESGLPEKFSLGQNYPNPFNPSTTIDYDLATARDVIVSISNVLGQEVARLVDARQPAGKYTVPFDASKLANGVYFYTLRAGSFMATKKMIFIK